MAESNEVLTLTVDIVSAYAGNARLSVDELTSVIRTVRATLGEDTSAPAPEPVEETAKPTSAQVRKSITPDALISFIDGKPYKTLKRHLTRHGMSMSDYRAKYGLPKDYPSVAASYSARRSEMAKSLGLGARGRGTKADPGKSPPSTPSKRGRKPAAAAPAQD